MAKRSRSSRDSGLGLISGTTSQRINRVADIAVSTAKKVSKFLNSEEMVLDTTYTANTTANSPLITHLNAVAQGDGQGNRTGNSILMSRIHSSEYHTTSASAVLCREVIVIDRQQIADTPPAWLDIFDATSPISLYSKLYPGRFTIVEDKTFVLATGVMNYKFRKQSKKLQKHAIFNGTTSADIQKNGLYKLFIADGVISLQHNYRLFYHDN